VNVDPTRRGLRRHVTAVALVALVGFAAVGSAGPAGAQSAPAPGTPRAATLCARAHNQWARAVTANKRANTAFNRAQNLQNRLLRRGRTLLAHRLDTRLAYLRQVHALLVSRVSLIAARVQGRCTEQPPTLASF
jgi:hypothetical protein